MTLTARATVSSLLRMANGALNRNRSNNRNSNRNSG